MMDYDKQDDALQHFMQQIREQLGNHLKQIILFGSRARGEDVPGSDYDCLIIVDEVTKALKDIIDEVTGEALYQHSAVFSAFLISEERHNRQPYNPLLINIVKEGMIL
jgi:predicted nucleotidyltransferase